MEWQLSILQNVKKSITNTTSKFGCNSQLATFLTRNDAAITDEMSTCGCLKGLKKSQDISMLGNYWQ